jgi:hypothetical protein
VPDHRFDRFPREDHFRHGRPRILPCRNMAGVDIPPCSLVKIQRFDPTSGLFEVVRVDRDNYPFRLGVTMEATILDGEIGIFTRQWPWWVSFSEDYGSVSGMDGIPAAQEVYGPKAGSFNLHTGYGGFVSYGGHESENGIIMADIDPFALPPAGSYGSGQECVETNQYVQESTDCSTGVPVTTRSIITLPAGLNVRICTETTGSG